jgi:hypothetical protein
MRCALAGYSTRQPGRSASTESGNSDGLSDYLQTRVDDEELARVIPDVDKSIAALELENSPQRFERLGL